MNILKTGIYKTIATSEAFVKGMMFDCRTCGQCVLTNTAMVCPMSCPKGLRNGPCGGTTCEKCEVYPDKSCVWVRIYKRSKQRQNGIPILISSPDSNLHHTSSYLNFLNGSDKQTRIPLDYLPFTKTKEYQTKSKLEQKLKQGRFVVTCEVRAPREGDFNHMMREARLIGNSFDAINVTAYLNGKPSLPSALAAAKLAEEGFEAISQATCRDHTKTSFVSELLQNNMNGVHNILCLTGDSYVGTPKIKQVFDMDSSLMLYEARHIREKSEINFTKQKLKVAPRQFLGAAINPFSTPLVVPVQRLKQKAAAGADFIQTQIILDIPGFQNFMDCVVEEKINEKLFILAGIPVIVSKNAYKMLPHIPGVKLPPEVKKRFDNTDDIRKEGIAFAREMLIEMQNMDGVSGAHLMLFGSDHNVLLEVIEGIHLKNEKS
ncbi:MAG: methylenetetrahydrofolate reductase C-terminal domain-containing protein [Bacteroidetes bacterium]|nr:methylenetetrahydrofolate reductase C-terminal domain-containing protein [Bacteroidota bacterium]